MGRKKGGKNRKMDGRWEGEREAVTKEKEKGKGERIRKK